MSDGSRLAPLGPGANPILGRRGDREQAEKGARPAAIPPNLKSSPPLRVGRTLPVPQNGREGPRIGFDHDIWIGRVAALQPQPAILNTGVERLLAEDQLVAGGQVTRGPR